VCHRPSASLNKEKVSREIRENRIAVCEKTQGLRRGNFSDLNSACSKVLVPVKIFQFHHMHYESERYRDAANGLLIITLSDYFDYYLYTICRRLVLLFVLNCERRLIVVLEHTSEALTEYLGQKVPSLASYSVNVLTYL
jgi:hypothetical protein